METQTRTTVENNSIRMHSGPNVIGHHSHPKTWGRQQPQNKDGEHGSHMGNRPQQSVREGKACTQQKNTWEKHTRFLREDSSMCVRGNNLTSARESTGHPENEQTSAPREEDEQIDENGVVGGVWVWVWD